MNRKSKRYYLNGNMWIYNHFIPLALSTPLFIVLAIATWDYYSHTFVAFVFLALGIGLLVVLCLCIRYAFANFVFFEEKITLRYYFKKYEFQYNDIVSWGIAIKESNKSKKTQSYISISKEKEEIAPECTVINKPSKNSFAFRTDLNALKVALSKIKQNLQNKHLFTDDENVRLDQIQLDKLFK